MPIKFSAPTVAGFTLIEALVAMLVIAVGLLGIASLQALALNNTIIAWHRSLVSMQVEGLATQLHANSYYWQSTSAPTESAGFTIISNGSTTTLSDSTLNSQNLDCTQVVCNTLQLAGYDLKQWGLALYTALPSGQGQISCVLPLPILCTITVSWSENNVELNNVSGTATGVLASGSQVTQTYSVVVQP